MSVTCDIEIDGRYRFNPCEFESYQEAEANCTVMDGHIAKYSSLADTVQEQM